MAVDTASHSRASDPSPWGTVGESTWGNGPAGWGSDWADPNSSWNSTSAWGDYENVASSSSWRTTPVPPVVPPPRIPVPQTSLRPSTPSAASESHVVPVETMAPSSSSNLESCSPLENRLSDNVVPLAPAAPIALTMRDALRQIRQAQVVAAASATTERDDLILGLNANAMESDWVVIFSGRSATSVSTPTAIVRDRGSRMTALGAEQQRLQRNYIAVTAPIIPLEDRFLGSGVDGLDTGGFVIHIPRGESSMAAMQFRHMARQGNIYWTHLRNDVALRLFGLMDITPPAPAPRQNPWLSRPPATSTTRPPPPPVERTRIDRPPSLLNRLEPNIRPDSSALIDRITAVGAEPIPSLSHDRHQSTAHSYARPRAQRPPPSLDQNLNQLVRRGRRGGKANKELNEYLDMKKEKAKKRVDALLYGHPQNTWDRSYEDDDDSMGEDEDGDKTEGPQEDFDRNS